MFMITQITDLVLLIVLKIVNKLFVQKTSFPFHYPLSLEFFLKILRFYRLHEACYGGFSLIRAIVLIFFTMGEFLLFECYSTPVPGEIMISSIATRGGVITTDEITINLYISYYKWSNNNNCF